MAKYFYDRLSALDNSFLLLEKPNAYLHVASTLIFEAGPLKNEYGGINVEAVKSLISSNLHLIPRYRQKLKYLSSENRPVWVDDDHFSLDYHIRHTSLPRPGTDNQLKHKSARIMERHLDRARPLWELWVVEGLEGDRFALISKVHHCMIDGISGVDLMKILMSPAPLREVPEPHSYIPRRAPSRMEFIREKLLRRVKLPYETLRDFQKVTNHAKDLGQEASMRLRSVAETLGATFRVPSETPLNHEIGPHRHFDWLNMDLGQVKSIRHALGGTVNDVVLTIVTGGVRRFLQRRQVNPSTVEFRIMAPVSVRTDQDHGTFGNRVSAWIVDLPVSESDPREQLKRIQKRTEELKESKQAVGAEILTQMAEWTSTTLLALGARHITRLLPFNMVVTNVPGPQFPLYLLGSPMLDVFPHVPLVDNLGLGVALMSYNGRICWGFNADYDLVPDLRAFVEGTNDAFLELRKYAGLPVEVEEGKEDTPAVAPGEAGPSVQRS